MDSIPPLSQSPGARLATIALELGPSARLRGDGQTRVHDVQQDSRRIAPGALFVARLGASADARARMESFVAQAIAHGASAVLTYSGAGLKLPPSISMIEVPLEQLRAAIGIAASAVHHHPSFSLEVIAITGTNGKTTVTTLLADALDRLAGRSACALIGTVGNRLGAEMLPATHTTPEADEIARVLSWARGLGASHAAIEASSHALDQDRLSGTRIRAAAFTNLTQDHLDYHGTMDAYFAAKKRLFSDLHPGDSVVNVDDPFGAQIAKEVDRALRVSCEGNEAEVRVIAQTIDARGVRATIATPRGEAKLDSRLLGAHNLANLALSLAVLVSLEIDPQRAADALGAGLGAKGRLQLASDPSSGEPVVLVDYAHTPDALARVLSTLRPLTRGRLICVFGCGGDRDPRKRAPMGEAVARSADVAVVTSDNPRSEDPDAIISAILLGMQGKSGVVVERERRNAIERAIGLAVADDVVLIAGKGHEDYQIIGTEKRPFDDVAEVRRALQHRAGNG